MKTNFAESPTEPTSCLANDQVLRLFLDSISDQAIFTVDPEGVVTSWNEGCRRMKGYSSAEAIGQNFSILYSSSDQNAGHPLDNLRVARREGLFHEERDRVRKNGDHFMAEVSIYPITEGGVITGFAKIVKDVSERRRLQEKHAQVEMELRQSNAELEGFSQSVAHDLRTPIRAIVSRCKIVQEDFAPIISKELFDNLETLTQRSYKLLRVVDDLLEFSRLGHGTIKRRSVDVSALTSRVAADLIHECHDGEASVVVQEGMRAEADPAMLELVLRNLIENSCKYSKPGVQVNVAMEVANGEPVYEVRDDGIGFDMAYAKSIFEPFQRLHREEVVSGTGLGLANVKRIVERHHGKVWAKSAPGSGASFFFTLGGNRAVTQLSEFHENLVSH